MSVNPEAKKAVIEALRSGEYKQGKGRLRIGECFCVQGVICDVYRKVTGGNGNWVPLEADPIGVIYQFGLFRGRYNMCYVPAEVIDWLGVDIDTKYFTYTGIKATIATLNDSFNVTFELFAKIFEEQLV